ncbi:PAS domain-containing hybrid sensor histidine kinase/response regulator [Oceanospirillum maris]|uniref:PAS domain-containing hybrid sensor histidine kinase/response regulator n=1 Tax=Oceanospirillum maris TaxID=64977 RepID=UPI0003FE4FAC|nr:PAS domain-containing hybrid sensor histidine kinase/response regulator [Oceanospirillum maris]
MSDKNLATLYEMALLMSSESSEESLVQKMLQHLTSLTQMPVGLFITQIEPSNDHFSFVISQQIVVGEAGGETGEQAIVNPKADSQSLTLNMALPEESGYLSEESFKNLLPDTLSHYTVLLFLPISRHDAFILLAQNDQKPSFSEVPFSPILANLAKTLQGLRSHAHATIQWQTEKLERQRVERMFELVLNHMPAGVYWQDLAGNIQGGNRRLIQDLAHIDHRKSAARLDINPSEIQHLDIKEIIDNTNMEQLQQDDHLVTDLGQEVQNKNYYLHCRDDSHFWIELNKVPIKDENQTITGILGIYRDITGRKLMMEELLYAKENAEQANRAKSSFLASMSHELRTPLNAIQGYAQLMEMDEDDLTEEHIESLQEIRKASNHLLQLIDEILDLSTIEAGRIDIHISSLNPIPMVQETMALNKPMADRDKIKMEACFPPNLSAVVLGDERRIKQILLNLISNAIKYNQEHGTIKLHTEQTTEQFKIHVTDTGIGMVQEQLDKLFQPFERLGMEATTRQGTGIGLVICQKLAAAMDGCIEVSSIPGVGSTFSLALPLAESNAEVYQTLNRKNNLPLTTHTADQSLDEANQASQKTTTLYVEDNPSNSMLVKKIYSKRYGDRLLTATTPEEGLDILRHESPDLVILDTSLPQLSGIDLIQHIKNEGLDKGCILVALSTNTNPVDCQQAEAAGFSASLTKPINIPEFNRQLNQWLSSH